MWDPFTSGPYQTQNMRKTVHTQCPRGKELVGKRCLKECTRDQVRGANNRCKKFTWDPFTNDPYKPKVRARKVSQRPATTYGLPTHKAAKRGQYYVTSANTVSKHPKSYSN
jgi:hypothetical protein